MTIEEFVVKIGFNIDQQGIDKANKAIEKIGDGVKKGVEAIAKNSDTIKDVGNTIADGIEEGMDKAKAATETGVEDIKDELDKVNKDTKDKTDLKSFNDGIKKGLTTALKIAKAGLNKIKGLFSKFGSGLKSIGNKLQSQIQDIFSLKGAAIFTAVSVASKKVYDNVKKIITGFTELNRETYATDKALEIMGKTMEEIQADPKLLAEFNELKKTAESIQLPPALPESVELLDSIGISIKKLRTIFDGFLKWTGYFLLKYLDKPLRNIKIQIDKLTKWLNGNMSRITEMIAKAIARTIKLVERVSKFFIKAFELVKKVLDKIPDSIKKIGLGFLILWRMLKTNPLMLIVSTLALLIDDFMTFLEGGESALGGLWKGVMKFINGLGGISGIIDKIAKFFTDFITNSINLLKDFWQKLVDKGMVENFKSAFTSIGEAVKKVFQAIGPVFDNLIRPFLVWLISTALPKAVGLFSDVAGKIADFVGWFAGLKNSKEILLGIVGAITAIVLAFKALLAIQTLINTVTTAYKAIQTAITTVTKAWTAAQALLNTALSANPIGLIIIAIVALIAIIVLLVKNWDTVKEVAGKVWDAIVGFVSGAVEKIKGLFTGIIDWVKSNWQAILLFIINPFAGAFKYLYDNFEGFRNFVDGVVESIKNFFKGIPDFFKNVFQGAVDGIKNVFGPIVDWFKNKVDTIKNFFGGIGDAVGGFFGGGKKTAGHAEGGIFDKEHIANFAEGDNAEAVIPLEGPNKKKGIGIAKKVNSILGLDAESKIIPAIKGIMTDMVKVLDIASNAQATTQAYNEIINNNTINNTYNNTQPIQLTVQVQMPAGGKVSSQEAQRFGRDVGKGILPQLNGILMDNRQGVFA